MNVTKLSHHMRFMNCSWAINSTLCSGLSALSFDPRSTLEILVFVNNAAAIGGKEEDDSRGVRNMQDSTKNYGRTQRLKLNWMVGSWIACLVVQS